MTKKQLISLKNQVDKISCTLDKILKEDYPEKTVVKARQQAPAGYKIWYEYLEYRRSKSDFHLLEWDSQRESSEFGMPLPIIQKYYFKNWCNEVLPGGFTEWMRNDIPEWTE